MIVHAQLTEDNLVGRDAGAEEPGAELVALADLDLHVLQRIGRPGDRG